MKKNVIVFGLISGLIVTAFMVYGTVSCAKNPDFENSMVLGYTAMLIAFSFIFVGIKNFRDKYNGGFITFGKAFKTGFFIALISSTMYVVTWVIVYHFFIPNFMDVYTEHVLKEAKNSGISAVEMQEKVDEMASYNEMYKNPVFVVLLTYAEVLPLGIIVALISALILKKKHKEPIATA